MDPWQEYNTFSQAQTDNAVACRKDDTESAIYPLAWPFGPGSAQDPYMNNIAMPWPSIHQAPMDTMRTPTQAMFSNGASSTTASFADTIASASETEHPYAPASHSSAAQQSILLDPFFTPPSLTSAFGTWEPTHCNSSRVTPVEAPSPSNSSQTSTVDSSPYAHSDGYFCVASPPMIKLEVSSDLDSNRLYSVPGTRSHSHPSHVNPGDVFAKPYPSQPSQASTPSSRSPKPEDCDEVQSRHTDEKLYFNESQPYQSNGPYATEFQNHVKRGFTTSATSTCHCKECGKLFQRSYNLKAHMATHDPAREQPHACNHPGCKSKFVRKTDLVRHEQSVHVKSRNFCCPLCHNSFARKDTLRRHIDDGCPRRPEVKKRLESSRRASSASSHQQYGSAMIPMSPQNR